MRNVRGLLGGGLALVATSAVMPACAQGPVQQFDLPAQELKYALRAVTRQAGYDLVATADLLEGRQAAALNGDFTPEQAIEHLLAGTGLVAQVSGRTVYIRARSAPRAAADQVSGDVDIVVTGTRIRGGAIASPSITISREAMRAAGQHTLADVIRTIPQNFGGGHNAGVGLNVPESAGVNTGSAVTLNLRGLGSDATLTLLNGHRLSYSATNQAIDVSAIPMAAIERIEIVADGASALYGSDSVAGVANIILRKEFDGLETRARFGGSTDGGYRQQQYSLLGGRSWADGGVLLAYEFGHDTPIFASQRAYAAERAPGLVLYPGIERHNLVASAHQALSPALTFAVDALYNRRRSHSQYALDARGDVLANGARTRSKSLSFAVAPSLRLALPDDWSVALTGMIGEDRTRYGYDLYADGAAIFTQRGCYCNRARSLELSASGDLLDLPAGSAKLALGGGFRTNDFLGSRDSADEEDIRASQDIVYAFGELALPLISPDQDSVLGERLNLSAALRYERYRHVDEVVTPKLGLVYSPSGDIDLKASWGRSFKAPRLHQQYNIQFATLYTAASRGGSGYPADATAILLTGGNPSLKPEHATTFSATAVIHPRAIPGLRAEASYFDIDYRDRIVTPIPFPSRSLADPIYADLVELDPTSEAQAAVIAGAGLFQNATAADYDPAKVVAIIHNTSLNAARQSIRGVDGSIAYDLPLAAGGSLGFMLNASYVRSRQRLSPLQAVVDLAGTIFNVPHLRARGGVTWRRDGASLAAFVSHIGHLRDPRGATILEIDAMTTVDLAARYLFSGGNGLLDDIGVALSVHNVFDTSPSLIRSTLPFEAPYDSTNHNAFGRVISLEVSKSW